MIMPLCLALAVTRARVRCNLYWFSKRDWRMSEQNRNKIARRVDRLLRLEHNLELLLETNRKLAENEKLWDISWSAWEMRPDPEDPTKTILVKVSEGHQGGDDP